MVERIASPAHTYKINRSLGNGSFGTVCEAICLETGETVAIKKVLQDPRYKNRELSVMKQLYHPNIVCLKDYFYTEAKSSDNDTVQRYLSLVMQCMPRNLYNSIRESSKERNGLGLAYPYVQVYAYQMLRALGYMHSLGLCHRDLKPQNVLVDPDTHIVKLCDLGSAKRLHINECSVSYICSRFYRAPELMLGSNEYTCAIDLWSAGCVIAEMILGKPLFAGNTSVEQLVKIIQLLGAPSQEEIVKMNQQYSNFRFPSYPPKHIKSLFPSNCGVPDSAFDLISAMLRFKPDGRLTPYEALGSSMFDDLRMEKYSLPNRVQLPPLFNFSEHELAQMPVEVRWKVLPSWLLEKSKNSKISYSKTK